MPTISHPPEPPQKPWLAADSRSPFFARVAAGYLEEGRTREALSLCLEGTKVFTRYPTGWLILGRCYEALGRTAEALVEYRRVLSSMPDSALAKELVEKAEGLERQAYKTFAEGLAITLKEKKDSVTFEEFITGSSATQSSTVEFLIRQLQQAPKERRGRITPVSPVTDEGEPPAAEAPVEPSSSIVTETLAEIYANQGQYREAIQAYQILTGERPGNADRYAERIAQLEELLKLQGEQGTETDPGE